MNGKKWLAVLLVSMTAACSSGPPACSGPEAKSILKRLLESEARILAILVTSPTRLYHEEMFAAAPAAIGFVQQRKFDEAFSAIEAQAVNFPDTGLGTLAKQAIAAAKRSSVQTTAIATTSEGERRASCSVTVNFSLGLPSTVELMPPLIKTGKLEGYLKIFDAARELEQQRKYDVYYTDAGEVVVELFAPE